jgi:hypothetical protein
MKKIINFGKIDYNQTGAKRNEVEIVIELTDDNNLSISGEIWNQNKTDILSGGQNLDTIKDYVDNKFFAKIYVIWKNYHLNDLNAGTTLQMDYLKSIEHKTQESKKNWYEWGCRELEKVDLLTTIYKNKPYKFGSGWIRKDIPKDILEFLEEEIFSIPTFKQQRIPK